MLTPPERDSILKLQYRTEQLNLAQVFLNLLFVQYKTITKKWYFFGNFKYLTKIKKKWKKIFCNSVLSSNNIPSQEWVASTILSLISSAVFTFILSYTNKQTDKQSIYLLYTSRRAWHCPWKKILKKKL